MCHALCLEYLEDETVTFDDLVKKIKQLRNELACSINGDRIIKIIDGLKGMSMTKIDSNAPIGGMATKR